MSEFTSTLIREIQKNGIPSFWLNTVKMQEAYSLETKGWTKKVEWKQSKIPGAGLGIFAGEFIPSGTSYRILKANQNLIILNGPKDIPPLTDATKQGLFYFWT